jgi:soluble lytic murein transglycosylase
MSRSPAAPRHRSNYRSSAHPARRRARTAPGRSALRALLVSGAIVALIAIVIARVQHDHASGGLPLTDAAVIREQAADKHLDPALIAAVIYAETKFEPRTSAAGALGLMQIEPETAQFIARRSGGIRFTTEDLATPKINLAYGSWYLRYLLAHYEGDEMLAVAAYNAGLANVDGWVAKARSEGGDLTVSAIPFPETKAYVERVLRAQREYRAIYPHALGLT